MGNTVAVVFGITNYHTMSLILWTTFKSSGEDDNDLSQK